jgi:hypothetical protein
MMFSPSLVENRDLGERKVEIVFVSKIEKEMK